MRKTIVLLLSVLALSLISLPAEAETITLLSQNYSVSGGACGYGPFPTDCFSYSQSSSSAPLSYSNSSTQGASLSLFADGGSDLSGGFLDARGSVAIDGTANATATMDFRAIDPAAIVVDFSACCPLASALASFALTDVTSNLVLLSFASNFGGSRSFTSLLNNTDTYRLAANIQVLGADSGAAHVRFSVPELPTIWLLVIALWLLCLGRRRLMELMEVRR